MVDAVLIVVVLAALLVAAYFVMRSSAKPSINLDARINAQRAINDARNKAAA
jgi:uncharacterized protein (UPF0333 family)